MGEDPRELVQDARRLWTGAAEPRHGGLAHKVS